MALFISVFLTLMLQTASFSPAASRPLLTTTSTAASRPSLPPTQSGAIVHFACTSSESSDDKEHPKTPVQQWKEKLAHVQKRMNSVEKAALGDLEEREKSLRLELKESIEELREKLLEQTKDYAVRKSVNQNFIDTRQQVKADLRKLRDKEANKIRAIQKESRDSFAGIDQQLSPLFMQLPPSTSTHFTWEEMKMELSQAEPLLDQLFTVIDGASSTSYVYENSPYRMEMISSMETFRSDMEDQLEDLEGNICFQIRIAEDEKRSSIVGFISGFCGFRY